MDFEVGDVIITRATGVSHCGIATWHTFERNRDKNIAGCDEVIHAQNKGIMMDAVNMWGTLSDVYRPVDLTKDDRKIIDDIAHKIYDSAKYSIGRAGFKSLGSSTYGAGAQERMKKYRERLKNHQGLVKHVFCSELVVLCYQIGFPDDHRLFIKLDAQKCWPSTLRTYLAASPQWAYRGTFPEND